MLLRGDEGVVNGDIRAFEKITKQIPQIGPCLKGESFKRKCGA